MKTFDIYYKMPYMIQNALIFIGKYYNDRNIDRYLYKIFNELKETEKYSLEELKELQRERLKNIVKIAYTKTKYYNDLFKKNNLHYTDIKELEDIKKIPLLTKKDIRENYKEMFNYSINKKDIFYSHTSGTTGTPLQFAMDYYTQAYYWAHMLRHRYWHNAYAKKEWMASFGGKKILGNNKDPLWRYDYADKLIIYSTFHFNNENMYKYYKHIKRKGIKYIKGYPSNIFIFASFLNKYNLQLKIKNVFVGAEPVYDFMRIAIEKAFQCKIADFYGNSEETARAYDCEEFQGLHIAMESILMEIEDDYSEIIGTNLTNVAMPFIRYKTGDYTKIINKKCLCGREHILIEPIKTKHEDIVYTKTNKLLSASILTFPFKDIKAGVIERSQIIQYEKGKIIVYIQKGDAFDKMEIKKLIDNFNTLFGNEIEVSIEYKNIDFTPGQKFRWVKKIGD